MLQLLRIRNLAIIEEVEIELDPGLTVVTGETGAGKSILIAALKLVLGGAGGAHLVRTGADRAEVEALFDLSQDPAARRRLADEGIDLPDHELVVRRVLSARGRTRAYIGGRLATAASLRRLASGLVDISSQHQHHTLVDARSHVGYLDAFGRLDDLRGDVAGAHAALVQARQALRGAEQRLAAREEREDLLRRQLDEVAQLDPQPGELDALAATLERHRHADRLLRVTSTAERDLYSADRAVLTQLSGLLRPLVDLRGLDADLDALIDRIDATHVELEEAARDLAGWSARLDLDPGQHQAMEERYHALKRLRRKHGGSLEAVVAWRAAAEAELADLSDAELRVDEAERALRRAQAAARGAAQALSEARRHHAAALGAAITQELHGLGMPRARLEVAVRSPPDGDGLDRLTALGWDQVEFAFAPNPGEAPRPLADVASGGELSRALLALKGVLSGLGPVGLYVFDEVDTGVGGAVAEVIGQKLRGVAAHHQVLCITHQPQVTVYGDQHLHVRKQVAEGRTFSQVHRLDPTERLEEVARMLGGIEVGEAAHQAAQALLESAQPTGILAA